MNNFKQSAIEKLKKAKMVESAKKLIAIYEQKTKDVVAKLWEK
jgi:hypothetical protein